MRIPTLPTIAEGVRTTKSIGTCARLLAAAGLDEMLRGDGPYTLFAPIDQAFDNLPPGELEALESDPARLRSVLEYHILNVGRELNQLRNAKLPTLQGELITASVTDDGVQVDHGNTRGTSLRCANGVIHPIDAVLFPGFTPKLSAKAQEESAWSGRRRIPRLAPAVPAQTAAQEAAALFETPAKASGAGNA